VDVIRQLRHLSSRFFEVARARPLSPREQAEVAGLLEAQTERALFWEQPTADQRHGLDSAHRALRAAPGRRDLARAALLHDVGKRRSGLGLFGRSFVSGFALIGLRLPGRGAAYLDHGPIGAADLEEAGSTGIALEYARHHHAARPRSVDAGDWAILLAADGD